MIMIITISPVWTLLHYCIEEIAVVLNFLKRKLLVKYMNANETDLIRPTVIFQAAFI